MRGVEDPVCDFKKKLRYLKKQEGLSFRDLQSQTFFSFGHLAQALRRGTPLPRWEVVDAMLKICNVSARVINNVWLPNWNDAKRWETENRPRRTRQHRNTQPAGFEPDPDAVHTAEQLAEQLRRLALTAGKPSAYKICQYSKRLFRAQGLLGDTLADMPGRSTIDDTLAGRHFPGFIGYKALVTVLIFMREDARHQFGRWFQAYKIELKPWIDAWGRAAHNLPVRTRRKPKPKPKLIIPPVELADEIKLVKRVQPRAGALALKQWRDDPPL